MIMLDTVFFDRVLKTLETNHNIVRSRQKDLMVTEAWLAFGDQLINQCKEILKIERYNEERDAVFSDMYNLIDDMAIDEDLFLLSMKKTIEKIKNNG